MDSHRAKRTVLRRCYDDLVLAISANPNALKYRLYANGLITISARKSKSANKIASSCDDTLMYDESAWDKLIGVLRRCDGGGIIADKLQEQLRELLGENAPGGNISGGQQNSQGKSQCCVKRCRCCACMHACVVGKRGLFMEAYSVHRFWLV